MITTDQLKTLQERVIALKDYLQIEAKKIEITNLEEKTFSPNFWNDTKAAELIMKELRNKKQWTTDYATAVTLTEDSEVLLEFFKEDEATETDVMAKYNAALEITEKLEFKNMLSNEGDDMSAVLQITAGAGGTESCDWAEMLMRMYIMWAEKNGYKVKELNFQAGDVAGVKTVTLEIEGDYSFGWLKGENGVHRLVRISPFDSNAKRHTSFASVYVYPLADDSIEIDINPADNNSETRSQLENREKAMQMLKSQLFEIELQKRNAARDEIESGKMKIEWGSQIRNYVLHPYKLIKDVRTGHETGNTDAVLNGDLDAFLKAFLMEEGQEKPSDEL